MANYLNIAAQVIDAAVAEAQPDSAGNWLDLVPKTHWGMSLGAFRAMAGAIVQAFETMIAPATLNEDLSIDGFWNKPLSEFRWALAGSVQ
jgi:hypothetical protein